MGSSSLLSAFARRLEGKVAVITGGASGIGECTAKLFCKHGAKVLIADIQDELAHSVCKDLGPTSASFVHCDVTDESDVRNAVDTAITKYGKLDIMFNNAGIIEAAKPANIVDFEKAEFEKILGVNLIGSFLGTKHAARVMVPARRGSIIITASVASIIGGTSPPAYTCSKHALVGLTRNTAVDLGRWGIRVNCVSPLGILTPFSRNFLGLDKDDTIEVYSNLKGAVTKPEDIAEAALYLGSDDSRYVFIMMVTIELDILTITKLNSMPIAANVQTCVYNAVCNLHVYTTDRPSAVGLYAKSVLDCCGSENWKEMKMQEIEDMNGENMILWFFLNKNLAR
ncbi:hypothetical protein HHK36_019379 [Tetracentron sinense]|uniref:Uncharacterized protein n=1 Tax=Tetracentron sinense TaxID=13715 RepID=A0A835D940_TETSI|nr:hypothetical protein HHK36_019379 [Tetracentron sinense]